MARAQSEPLSAPDLAQTAGGWIAWRTRDLAGARVRARRHGDPGSAGTCRASCDLLDLVQVERDDEHQGDAGQLEQP
jgi:hypothetical protein